MKLHLGCGENYLKGYVNIDYPSSRHTVQTRGVADVYEDLRQLQYPVGSIEEIRLHHVFEHFPRAIACALVSNWNQWLQIRGLLRIEVPDFQKTAEVVLQRFSTGRQKNLALRHIFGSQEADWAVHYTGWTESNLTNFLSLYGFSVEQIVKSSYRGTYNLEVFSRKNNSILTRSSLRNITRKYLKSYTLDDSDTEKKILSVWMKEYATVFKKAS